MPRWFLSYHSPDEALALRLKSAVEHKDPSSRVFFAPSGLRAGRSWTRTLADEIAAADAFILLIGESGLGDWQVLEYDEALDRWVTTPDFPLSVVLLEGQSAPGLPFLRRLHWIVTGDPASETCLGRLLDSGGGAAERAGDLWRYTSPYRGLAAMEEKDGDYFFGRERETIEVLAALASGPDRLPILIGNSGVGKSSLAKAGVLAALKRQAWPEEAPREPWPALFRNSRQWCFLSLKPGAEPLKSLVEAFLETWQYSAADPERARLQNEWIAVLRDGKAGLGDLLDATERRYDELHRARPPTFFLYVDQGEELYTRADPIESTQFSQILATALRDPRLRAMVSLRSDFLGGLQRDEALFAARIQIDVPPLRGAVLRKIVGRPAELLSARFENPGLVDIITRRTVEDSVKDVGALPLLSYTLDDMWQHMKEAGDGVLRLPGTTFELGGVLVERADSFLALHPGTEDALRRVLTLRLASVREGEEPTRRRALRSEFTGGEWQLVGELADSPNRLLVIVDPESGETYAEVAHEAIFRRWEKLRDWIAAEREFLSWRSGLEAARRAWQSEGGKDYALLMGAALAKAQNWRTQRGDDLVAIDREFIDRSFARERRIRRRSRQIQGLAYAMMAVVIVGLIGWINQDFLQDQMAWFVTMRPYAVSEIRPYVLSPTKENALQTGETFRECRRDCPEMVVVPAGAFTMGSSVTEPGRQPNEGPQHRVTIARAFAASRYELTFDEWNACAAHGGCGGYKPNEQGWGEGQQPVINVTWAQARSYVAWLARLTGKPYRLLSEAEWEYAARAGATGAYSWGDMVEKNRADCAACGSQWDGRQPAPVGSFPANRFGLFDMGGNVYQWVEDCYHPTYQGAPADGTPWVDDAGCGLRVVRSGSWDNTPADIRPAYRDRNPSDFRANDLGIRVGRTLSIGLR
jgi:formylglycine-generating enzyme required for sulfatase activity